MGRREGEVTSRLTVLSCSAEYEESWNPFVFKVGSVDYFKKRGEGGGKISRTTWGDRDLDLPGRWPKTT